MALPFVSGTVHIRIRATHPRASPAGEATWALIVNLISSPAPADPGSTWLLTISTGFLK